MLSLAGESVYSVNTHRHASGPLSEGDAWNINIMLLKPKESMHKVALGYAKYRQGIFVLINGSCPSLPVKPCRTRRPRNVYFLEESYKM